MNIYVQVFYDQKYWIHHLKRIDGKLYWVHEGFKDLLSEERFTDCPLLSPKGRDMQFLKIPYMEGDL